MAMMYAERAPSRQITGAAAVIGVHAALIFAIVTGLTVRPPIVVDEPPFEYVPVPEAPPENTEPVKQPSIDDTQVDPLPIPKLPPLDHPMDDVVIAEPIITDSTPPIRTAAVSPHSPLRSDPRFPLAQPDYPASAVRANQEGTVQLLIYVLPNGRVGDVKIARSSGYPLLDASAARKAKAAWRFLPATTGGQAIAAWGTFDVRFELKIN